MLFSVGHGVGLVVDPLASTRRRYVFDPSCTIGPTDAVLAVPSGAAAPGIAAREPMPREKLVRVADGYTLLRRATGQKIDRVTRASRRASAVFSAACSAAIVGITWLDHAAKAHHWPTPPDVFDLDLSLGLAALAFAIRALRPRLRRRRGLTRAASRSGGR